MAHPLRQDIVLELKAQGWHFEITKKNHIRGTHPQASGTLRMSGTPGDARNAKHIRTQARRLLDRKEQQA
jgi:hypothetical protein